MKRKMKQKHAWQVLKVFKEADVSQPVDAKEDSTAANDISAAGT